MSKPSAGEEEGKKSRSSQMTTTRKHPVVVAQRSDGTVERAPSFYFSSTQCFPSDSRGLKQVDQGVRRSSAHPEISPTN
jgi:hypothetical protein